MQWIRSIVREVFGLFVDDGSFAIATLVWVGIVWLLSQHLYMERRGGLVLFAGLGVILFESVLRVAKRSTRSSDQL